MGAIESLSQNIHTLSLESVDIPFLREECDDVLLLGMLRLYCTESHLCEMWKTIGF